MKHKKTKNPILNGHISKIRTNLKSKFIFLKVNSVSLKQRYFKDSSPLKTAGAAVSSLQAQKFKNQPGKTLNLLFFVYFCGKRAETFNKLQFSSFGQKLWKNDIKKKKKKNTQKLPIFNGHISKTSSNLESKLRILKSLLNFLQNSISYAPYWCGYTKKISNLCNNGRLWQQLPGLKGLTMRQKKFRICRLLSISFWNELKLSTNFNFSPLVKINPFN